MNCKGVITNWTGLLLSVFIAMISVGVFVLDMEFKDGWQVVFLGFVFAAALVFAAWNVGELAAAFASFSQPWFWGATLS